MSAYVPEVPHRIPDDTSPGASPESPAVLTLTGERTIPDLDIENYWFRRHQVVYQRLAPRCAGREVLEAGCGEGYGADLIARVARRVVAVDYDAMDPGARDYNARRGYGQALQGDDFDGGNYRDDYAGADVLANPLPSTAVAVKL